MLKGYSAPAAVVFIGATQLGKRWFTLSQQVADGYDRRRFPWDP